MRIEKKTLVAVVVLLILTMGLLNMVVAYFFTTLGYVCPEAGWLGIRDLLFSMAPWELMILVTVTYPLYVLFRRYREEVERHEAVLELLLMAVSHKIGNFLSTQRLNLEMLKEGRNGRVLDRLVRGNADLTEDLERLVKTLKGLGKGWREERLDLKALVEALVEEVFTGTYDRKVRMSLRRVELRGMDPAILRNVLHPLFENAWKYSRGRIHIRLGRGREGYYLAIRNDLGEEGPRGSGLGIYIAEKLGGLYGLKLATRSKGGRYLSLLVIPRK